MAVKLDISKAYDRAEWSFLKEIMEKMGFDSDWVGFADEMCHYSILLGFLK